MDLDGLAAEAPRKTGTVRVVNLLPDPRVGGPQRRVALLAKEIQPLGYETIVVIPPGPAVKFFGSQGVQCVAFDFPRPRRNRAMASALRFGGGLPYDVVRLATLLREVRADILHCNGLLTLIGPPAGRLAGTATLWHLNDMLMPRIIHRVLLAGFGAMVDRIAVSSRAVAQHALEANVPYVVLHPPAEVALTNSRNAILSGFGLDPRLPTAVTVGHLNAIKGHRYLLEAIALLRAKGRHVQLLVVGERVDPDIALALEAQIANGHLGDRVRLVGPAEDIGPFLAAADLFVFPSLSESMGMALLEAMAAGLPVVSTDVGGVTEALEDGVQGLLVPPGDPQALAQQIGRILDDPQASREMGRRAREVVVERFSTRAIAMKQVQLYQELMDAR